MMRSLFSGISGLKTHQTRMDVIGNNIANVNTVSYKSMSVNFSDLMYQNIQAATGPSSETGRGGTNPKQIGLGVQTASFSSKITEEGASQTTGNPFDLKIAGDEFFVVSDGYNTFFTRDGSFNVDAAGNLVMSSNGYNIMGWQAVEADDGTLMIKKDTVSALKVMDEANLTYPAQWTQSATASGILDWNDKDQQQNAGKSITVQFYDNLGYSYTAKFSLHNAHRAEGVDDSYSFYTELEDIVDANGKTILTDANRNKLKFGTTQDVSLDGETYGVNNGTVEKKTVYKRDANGVVTQTTLAYVNYTDSTTAPPTTSSVLLYPSDANTWFTDQTGNTTAVTGTALFNADGTVADEDIFKDLYGDAIDPANIKAGKTDAKGNIIVTKKTIEGAVTLQYSGYDGSLQSPKGGATLDLTGLGDAFSSIDIDFTKTLVSDNKGKSTMAMEKGNVSGGNKGRSLGALQSISIQTDGQIFASYSNGQRKLLGQIAVAQFANASGLQKEGSNLYSSTTNSGDFDGIGVDISNNGHQMNTGVLEMSNVDLSSEFTDMITTQRGFQANSRIITVSDTLLEELVNLKR